MGALKLQRFVLLLLAGFGGLLGTTVAAVATAGHVLGQTGELFWGVLAAGDVIQAGHGDLGAVEGLGGAHTSFVGIKPNGKSIQVENHVVGDFTVGAAANASDGLLQAKLGIGVIAVKRNGLAAQSATLDGLGDGIVEAGGLVGGVFGQHLLNGFDLHQRRLAENGGIVKGCP
jgi:hypothetical protein